MFGKKFVLSAFVAGLAAISTTGADAASIGINFTGGGNGGSPAVSLLPTDVAGVVPQSNFNNFAGGNATAQPLLNNAGAATTAVLTSTAGGTYSSVGGGAIAPAGGDEKLNTGFVYGNGTFTVTGVPYARYDVYVYTLNDAAGRVQTTSLVGGPTYYNAAADPVAGHVDQNAATPYTYVRSTSTDVNAPTAGGDYALFTGVVGPSFTITSAAPGNGYVNGIQIVESVPEPTALGLFGVAAVAALARRRRTA